ncbi:MAG: hypothetical protein JWO38_83 [Gemmataceae bacterium]|nr:hypothetical protein [Gemmataceae bacterium]
MTATAKTARRDLTFDDLDAVVRDAEHLHAAGYERVGVWDLAQVCGHLADWMRFPVEGFPKVPSPIRAMMWVMRHTIGKAKFRKIIDQRAMATGIPTIPQTVALPGSDAAAAVAKLKETAERFEAYAGGIHPSPFFGAMTKDDATRLQLVHCAHHLSFLVPKS